MKTIAVFTTMVLGVSVLVHASESTLDASNRGARFLALGDSYTIGESVKPAERWPSQLVARLHDEGIAVAEPKIIAKTGWTTDELNAAIDHSHPEGPFNLVTLLIGVNNQYRGRDVEEYRTQFRGLLNRSIGFAGGHPQHVIVIAFPDWGATPFATGRDRARIAHEIDVYNAVNREEALALGARYVDIAEVSRKAATDPTLTANDGLHPSPALYAEWVARILPEARAALKQ